MRLYNYLENIEVLQTNVTRFDMEIRGVTSRLDEVAEGDAFVCVKGMRTDGHSLALRAKERGAVLLVAESLCPRVIEAGLPYIAVADTRAVLARMCAKAYGNPERYMKLIGVTGTNGKTSVCRILSQIYEQAGRRVTTLGTLDGGLTTPDPEDLFRMLKLAFDRGSDTVVMEASSHALNLRKLDGIRFSCGVFTNLTPEHLDFHKNMEEYASSKAVLFENSDCGIYNADDPAYREVSARAAGRCYTCSATGAEADYYAKNVEYRGADGISYTLVTPRGEIAIETELCGSFNLYNTLMAGAVAYNCGVSDECIRRGIAKVDNVPGRLERIDLGDVPFSVYIDYAHTPDALEKVLRCIRAFKGGAGKLILLFGCGGDRDRSKRKVMGQIASRLSDFVVVTSDNSRSEKPEDIITEILKGVDKERPYKVITDRKTAIEYAISIANTDDVILLAGKGHEDYEIGKDGKTYFNEKEIAKEAVIKRFKKK